MGYQESFLYIEPQWKFEKLIRTYEKAEQTGYYRVAGAEPRSVVVLKQPLGQYTGRKAAAVGVRRSGLSQRGRRIRRRVEKQGACSRDSRGGGAAAR